MARFAVSNTQDQSATLWITAFLLLSYTTLTTLVRGFVKLSMLGLDDGIACIAQLLTYGNVFSIVYALRHGLARSSINNETGSITSNYGEVSNAHGVRNAGGSWLIWTGTTSEHHTIPSGIGCGQGSHHIVLEKSLPTVWTHTHNATVQSLHDSHGWLGCRIGCDSVC